MTCWFTGSMTTSPQEPTTRTAAGYVLRGGPAAGTIVRGGAPEFVRIPAADGTADVYKPTGERDEQRPEFERYDFEPIGE